MMIKYRLNTKRDHYQIQVNSENHGRHRLKIDFIIGKHYQQCLTIFFFTAFFFFIDYKYKRNSNRFPCSKSNLGQTIANKSFKNQIHTWHIRCILEEKKTSNCQQI